MGSHSLSNYRAKADISTHLVEETHAHVVVGLFLGLLLLFFLGGRGAATSAAGGGSSCDGTTATGRHRGELLGALLEQLLEVLKMLGKHMR